MHAFDILCNAILASSVDIVVAVLPQVQDVHSFISARPGIQNLLESFLRCASHSPRFVTAPEAPAAAIPPTLHTSHPESPTEEQPALWPPAIHACLYPARMYCS